MHRRACSGFFHGRREVYHFDGWFVEESKLTDAGKRNAANVGDFCGVAVRT